jgi:hypothetical protein
MAIEYSNSQKLYIALSTDDYPENPDVGAVFYCLDTQEKYVYADGQWEPYMGAIL